MGFEGVLPTETPQASPMTGRDLSFDAVSQDAVDDRRQALA